MSIEISKRLLTLLSYQLRIDETETQKKHDAISTQPHPLIRTIFHLSETQKHLSLVSYQVQYPQLLKRFSATDEILSTKEEPKKAISALTEIYISRPFQL